uniref:Putative secreted protein n=1 Tax=Anopheles marajoara TaxID=58244 RepID=A0A2M4CEA7_9DIPT
MGRLMRQVSSPISRANATSSLPAAATATAAAASWNVAPSIRSVRHALIVVRVVVVVFTGASLCSIPREAV